MVKIVHIIRIILWYLNQGDKLQSLILLLWQPALVRSPSENWGSRPNKMGLLCIMCRQKIIGMCE